MMAIEELMKAGYSELVWLGGGFNNVRDGDFVTIENGTKLQWATVGGASELFLKFAVLLSNLSNSISGSSAVKEKWTSLFSCNVLLNLSYILFSDNLLLHHLQFNSALSRYHLQFKWTYLLSAHIIPLSSQGVLRVTLCMQRFGWYNIPMR